MQVSAATGTKVLNWQNIVVGETLGPMRVIVDEQLIANHVFAMADFGPWFTQEGVSPFGDRVAHAGALLPDLLRLLDTVYDPNLDLGLHLREQVWFLSPAYLGEEVELTGRIVDKYVNRGRGCFVTDAEARSVVDGRLLVRHRSIEAAEIGDTTTLGGGSAQPSATRRVGGEYPSDVPTVVRLHRDLTVGAPVAIMEKTLSQAQMSVFSNVQEFWHTTHTDLAVARSQGLDRTLAQGLMNACYLSEYATRFFGPTWFRTGELEVVFLNPMGAGDRLRIFGVVSDIRSTSTGETVVEVETWIDRVGDDKRLAAGWLAAIVADPERAPAIAG